LRNWSVKKIVVANDYFLPRVVSLTVICLKIWIISKLVVVK
jgi:hypothetical protein